MVSKKHWLNLVFAKSWTCHHWYSSWSNGSIEFPKTQLKYYRHFYREKIVKIPKLLQVCQPPPTNMDFPGRKRMRPLIPSKEWLTGKRWFSMCKSKTRSRQRMSLNPKIDPQYCSKHFLYPDEQFLKCKLKECCSVMPLKCKSKGVQQIR